MPNLFLMYLVEGFCVVSNLLDCFEQSWLIGFNLHNNFSALFKRDVNSFFGSDARLGCRYTAQGPVLQ